MSDVRRHLCHALTTLVALALVSGALVGLAAEPAEARVPKAAARYTAAIEPLARYVGQSTCSPRAKPGTVAFANLLLRTYKTSRSLGISRSCGVGGKSEHKEGRAFDWGVSINKAKDRAAVRSLMKWLLKKDAYGNRHAMARRLGIQYMIWNRRIWGAYAAGRGWRKYTGSNPHTDHVHFSLSWTGARKKTSFWNPRNFPNSSGFAPGGSGKPSSPNPGSGSDTPSLPTDNHDWPDPRPDEHDGFRSIPEPRAPRVLEDADPLVVEKLHVSATRRAGNRTSKALVAGHRYLIEVSGTYRYDSDAGSLADAECSTRGGASWWQRERSLTAQEWYADHLDLYVDGHDLYAEADNGADCDERGHSYRWVYEAERSGRVPFVVWDPTGYADNGGRLTVRVLDLDTVRDSMTWKVPSQAAAGATSPGLLEGGRSYRVTVSGRWQNGRGGVADAECELGSDGTWRRDGDGYDISTGEWGYDSLAPRISGVRGLPVGGGDQCDAGHAYSWVHTPERTSPLNIRVGDPDGHDDNSGALTVTVAPYGGSSTEPQPAPAPEPEPLPEPEPVAPELLTVDARSAQAVRTSREYPAGTTLRVTATGTYLMREASDWIAADAECSATSRDYTWRSSRYDGVWAGRTSPLGDLAVNGRIITWLPSDGSGSCDSGQHIYTYELTTTTAGPLWFVIADDEYGDNKGSLEVQVEMK